MAESKGWHTRKLILVLGKGGVGKSLLARAAAHQLAAQGKRVLLCHVLQIAEKSQVMTQLGPGLWEIYLNSTESFAEYVSLKIKIKSLTKIFLGNRVTRYLEKAAPGVREMVLMGKVWYEREHYDHVVVDMPSSGYALTMLHTPFNFAALFPGGPIYHDAKSLIETFSNPEQTALVTVSLAEEMPLQESIEIAENLSQLVPKNPPWLIVNRKVSVPDEARALYDRKWGGLAKGPKDSPLWRGLDYLATKSQAQEKALESFRDPMTKLHQGVMFLEDTVVRSEEERLSVISNLFGKLFGAVRA